MFGPKETGGQAFPRAGYDGPEAGERPEDGMTLRDWFAGQALVGMGTWTPPESEAPQDWDEKAWWAYKMADAMLEARRHG